MHWLQRIIKTLKAKLILLLMAHTLELSQLHRPLFMLMLGHAAALLGRLLPSDGHKLVKKPEI